MKYSELPASCGFAVINTGVSMPLLAKSVNGQIVLYMTWSLVENSGVTPDTEVQPVHIKTPIPR